MKTRKKGVRNVGLDAGMVETIVGVGNCKCNEKGNEKKRE